MTRHSRYRWMIWQHIWVHFQSGAAGSHIKIYQGSDTATLTLPLILENEWRHSAGQGLKVSPVTMLSSSCGLCCNMAKWVNPSPVCVMSLILTSGFSESIVGILCSVLPGSTHGCLSIFTACSNRHHSFWQGLLQKWGRGHQSPSACLFLQKTFTLHSCAPVSKRQEVLPVEPFIGDS